MQTETSLTTEQLKLVIKHQWLRNMWIKWNITTDEFKDKRVKISKTIL